MNNWAIQIIGIDGCGKSTIAEKLAKDLNDFTQEPETKLVHEPDHGVRFGKDFCTEVYDLAFGNKTCTPVARELLLLASRSVSTKFVAKCLESKNIISDRGFMCGYAYNKIKCALPPHLWWEFSKQCMNYVPDVVFYIEADKPKAIGREGKEDMDYDRMSELDRAVLLQGYEEIIDIVEDEIPVIRFKNDMSLGPELGYQRFLKECLMLHHHEIMAIESPYNKNKSFSDFIWSLGD